MVDCEQEILTQLRTIFDLIINFQGIQESMYRAAKDELEARQNYENSKMTSEERVNILVTQSKPHCRLETIFLLPKILMKIQWCHPHWCREIQVRSEKVAACWK